MIEFEIGHMLCGQLNLKHTYHYDNNTNMYIVFIIVPIILLQKQGLLLVSHEMVPGNQGIG